MPSTSSSPFDPHCQCGHVRMAHSAGRGPCIDCSCDAFKLDEPPESASSSPDDRCGCTHPRRVHDSHHCAGCHVDSQPDWSCMHGFQAAEQYAAHVHEWSKWATSPNDHLLRGTQYAYCPCGASKARGAEPEKPQECDGIRATCKQPRCAEDGCAKAQPPVCTHCEGPHDTKDCKGLEEPEEAAYAAHDFISQEHCKDCGDTWGRQLQGIELIPRPKTKDPSLAPHRPPYAVAYAVEGGALYEVAVPGDATVVAEDGVLQVLHPKRPVLAIVRITPMNMEENDG